jgi:Ca-activated chloride channel family protein
MNKHRWLTTCLIVVAISIGGLAAVRAQQPQTQKPKQGDKPKPAGEKPETQDVQEPPIATVNVRLPISVVDKSNRFITDLKEGDFEVYEDKVPQRIESFLPQSELPLDIAVLMDTSNSVKPKLKFEKEAAISFIQTVLRPRKDRALFLTFDSEIELHQDFTDRVDLLSRAIEKVKARGETRMYDAIYRVCEEKMFASPGRRHAMVIITDGEDTVSERTLKEAIDIAQRSETVVYAISTKAGGFFGVQAGMVDRQEDKDLKRLAEETGGRAFFTGEVLELEKSFAAIARELRSQYLLAYEPTNNKYDGKFRQVEVRLPGHKDLKVRTRKGYSALPRTASVK